MTTMKQSILSAIGAVPLLFATAIAADDQDKDEKVRANLAGYQEVPTLSSDGTATFRARIANDDQSFDWVLTYSGLTNVTQAHIHFAARAIAGPVVIFFCSNLGNGPPGTQACPTSAGTLTGTARAADVLAGAASLGIPAGDFARILAAIRAGATYANIHTVAHPPGEIRGQIHSHSDH